MAHAFRTVELYCEFPAEADGRGDKINNSLRLGERLREHLKSHGGEILAHQYLQDRTDGLQHIVWNQSWGAFMYEWLHRKTIADSYRAKIYLGSKDNQLRDSLVAGLQKIIEDSGHTCTVSRG